jgi:hypothetical protein
MNWGDYFYYDESSPPCLRQAAIQDMNTNGAGYTERHGK